MRHAYFATFLGENHVISEEIAEWDSDKECVEWHTEEVTINKATMQNFEHYFDLLSKPNVAFKELFPLEASYKKPESLKCDSKDWLNHCFACKCLVSEMCCSFKHTELLGEMLQ